MLERQVLVEMENSAFNQKTSNVGERRTQCPPKPTPKILLSRESFLRKKRQ